MDGKIDIVLIVLAVEERLEPQRAELLIKLVDLPLELLPQAFIILGGVQLYKLLKLIDLLDKLLPRIVSILEQVKLGECLFRLLRIIPEVRRGCLLLKGSYLIGSPSLFKDASIRCRLLPLYLRTLLCFQ